MPFEMDAWGLDVVVTGSQKAWMIPPGLAMVAVSERAWAAAETATHASLLLRPGAPSRRARQGRDALDAGRGARHPAGRALELIDAEGYPAIFARHAACAAASRAGLAALGFQLFADPAHASTA